MELSEEFLKSYVSLLATIEQDLNPAAELEAVRAEVISGQRLLAHTRIFTDGTEKVLASIRVHPLDKETWILTELKVRADLDLSCKVRATDLIPEAMSVAMSECTRKVETRISSTGLFKEYRDALVVAGFKYHGDRVEFKTAVSELPDDTGTPFTWKAMTTEDRNEVAQLLGSVGHGDPDWDEQDDPACLLEEYLSDPILTRTFDTVQIGHLDDQVAALVIAQVATKTRWSRITYLGLLPQFRGKGYGHWVHKHGFTMIKSQRGRTYQGGCSSINRPMLSLFRRHGCREHLLMQDWIWRARGS
jgi:GNAT superfamily N-acetyltransferase